VIALLFCVTGNTTCLRCLQDDGCSFCRDTAQCSDNKTIACEKWEDTVSTQCVEDLGGDAKQSVRYAIGFAVLAVAIAIDLTVRFIAHREAHDQYSHL
jgi:hypothetical protein